jgi:hypothetical protein
MSGSVILVTGGTGLVGKAIEQVIETEPEGSRFGKKPNEKWIFASSSEGDLKWVSAIVRYVTDLNRFQGYRADQKTV